MTFEQFYRILRARRKLAISMFLSILAFAIAFSLLWPKTYTATAAVVIDLKADPVSGLTQAALMQPSGFVATQVSIIKSDAVARRVVKKMDLASNPEMVERWKKDTEGRGSIDDWMGKFLMKGLSVNPTRDSTILEIEYESVEPTFAAALANEFAKSYMETLVQMRTDPARAYTNYFEERAKLAREKLERAQARLSAAQKERGILSTDERLDSELIRLNEMGGQLVGLRGLAAESSGRRNAASNSAEQTQEVLANGVIGALKADLARMQAKMVELQSTMGDNHPVMVQVRANIAETQRSIATEMRRVTGSIAATDNITTGRKSAAQQAYDAQREKLLKMKEQRNDLALFEREVESAQRVYEAIQLRQSQSSLESNTNQSNAYMLSQAEAPPTHSSPKAFLNVILAFTVGGVATLLVTLAAELLDRRVRTSVDLIQSLELPVIGVLPNPYPKKLKLFGKKLTYGQLLPHASPAR